MIELARAIELDPNLAASYRLRADIYERQGHYVEEFADLRRLVEVDPQCAIGHYKLGMAYMAIDEEDLAIDCFDRAIEIDPANDAVFASRARAYEKLGQNHESLADWSELISREPSRAKRYLDRGELFAKMKLFDRAIEDFTSAIAIAEAGRTSASYLARSHSLRGNAYEDIGQLDAALRDYTSAIEKGGHQAGNLVWRAMLNLEMGKLGDALQDVEQAIDLEEDQPQSWQVRGKIRIEMGQYELAIADYSTALTLMESWSLHCERGEAYQNLGNHAQAIEDFDSAIKLGDDVARSYYSRAVSLRAIGQFEAAEEDERAALAIEAKQGMDGAS